MQTRHTRLILGIAAVLTHPARMHSRPLHAGTSVLRQVREAIDLRPRSATQTGPQRSAPIVDFEETSPIARLACKEFT